MDKIIEGHPDVANLVGQLNLSHSEVVKFQYFGLIVFHKTQIDYFIVKFVRYFSKEIFCLTAHA